MITRAVLRPAVRWNRNADDPSSLENEYSRYLCRRDFVCARLHKEPILEGPIGMLALHYSLNEIYWSLEISEYLYTPPHSATLTLIFLATSSKVGELLFEIEVKNNNVAIIANRYRKLVNLVFGDFYDCGPALDNEIFLYSRHFTIYRRQRSTVEFHVDLTIVLDARYRHLRFW